MSLRSYLVGLSLSIVLCWTAFFLTILNTNPEQGGQSALLAFYFSLTFAVLSTLTLAGYLMRRRLSRNEAKYVTIRVAFRQAFLAAGVLAALAVLQAARLLSLWDIVLLLVIAVLLELYLRSYARPARL